MIVGQRWLTRSGAVVEIIERRDTGLVMRGLDCRPLGPAMMLICRLVRYVDGHEPLTDEPPQQFALFDDGTYTSRPHALDLMTPVQAVAA